MTDRLLWHEVRETIKLNKIHHWRGRMVVWLAALTAGLVVVLFARVSDFALAHFFPCAEPTLGHRFW
ncbi:MAG TPA: hypothetical protein VIM43_01205 [Rugosibacter sp.]